MPGASQPSAAGAPNGAAAAAAAGTWSNQPRDRQGEDITGQLDKMIEITTGFEWFTSGGGWKYDM